MEKKLFTIGEISKIKGITRKALRFYEKIGLLKPYRVDPSNRYRYYSIEQFVHVDIIKAARVMDISPMELKAVFKNKDTVELMEFLDSQMEKAARKMDELRQTIRRINAVQKSISNSLASAARKEVYRRQIPPRTIVTLAFDNIASSEAAIIEFSRFDRIIEEHRLINTYESGIVLKTAENGVIPTQIFNTVEVDEDSDASITSTLPAGEYVCICYNQENAARQSNKISKYCRRNGLSPALILQVELLIDVFSIGPGFVELQMLV